MKKVLYPLLGVILFILAVGLLTKSVQNGSLKLGSLSSSSETSQKQVKINDKTVFVEVASTDAARAKGLSGRTSLASDSGMLFTFPQNNVLPNFWMKDMQIALDIVWIGGGKVVKIDRNAQPEPGKKDSELTIYRPNQPVDYVLEVNAGFCDANNIKEGDSVDLSGI